VLVLAALFALGLMSLGWMALVAALIAGEKLLPRPAAARRTVAVLLLVLGLGVAFAPAHVPGFVESGGEVSNSGSAHGAGMQMTR